jgi:hypothetical protein
MRMAALYQGDIAGTYRTGLAIKDYGSLSADDEINFLGPGVRVLTDGRSRLKDIVVHECDPILAITAREDGKAVQISLAVVAFFKPIVLHVAMWSDKSHTLFPFRDSHIPQ